MGLGTVVKFSMRGFEFLWALLVLAIVGNMIASSNHNANIVGYGMFCAVFGMLSLFYLIPATVRDSLAISPWFPLILDILNTIFWFCGAVALAAELGVHSCSNKPYLASNHIINTVKNGRSGRCHEAQASDAFLFFGFFAFATSAVFSGLDTRGGASLRPSSIRRSGPAMSRV